MSHPHLSWPLSLLLVAVLLTQGIWLFVDARRHNRWPWLWGLWGLISFPLPTILYLILARQIWRRRPSR